MGKRNRDAYAAGAAFYEKLMAEKSQKEAAEGSPEKERPQKRTRRSSVAGKPSAAAEGKKKAATKKKAASRKSTGSIKSTDTASTRSSSRRSKARASPRPLSPPAPSRTQFRNDDDDDSEASEDSTPKKKSAKQSAYEKAKKWSEEKLSPPAALPPPAAAAVPPPAAAAAPKRTPPRNASAHAKAPFGSPMPKISSRVVSRRSAPKPAAQPVVDDDEAKPVYYHEDPVIPKPKEMIETVVENALEYDSEDDSEDDPDWEPGQLDDDFGLGEDDETEGWWKISAPPRWMIVLAIAVIFVLSSGYLAYVLDPTVPSSPVCFQNSADMAVPLRCKYALMTVKPCPVGATCEDGKIIDCGKHQDHSEDFMSCSLTKAAKESIDGIVDLLKKYSTQHFCEKNIKNPMFVKFDMRPFYKYKGIAKVLGMQYDVELLEVASKTSNTFLLDEHDAKAIVALHPSIRLEESTSCQVRQVLVECFAGVFSVGWMILMGFWSVGKALVIIFGRVWYDFYVESPEVTTIVTVVGGLVVMFALAYKQGSENRQVMANMEAQAFQVLAEASAAMSTVELRGQVGGPESLYPQLIAKLSKDSAILTTSGYQGGKKVTMLRLQDGTPRVRIRS